MEKTIYLQMIKRLSGSEYIDFGYNKRECLFWVKPNSDGWAEPVEPLTPAEAEMYQAAMRS